jgi:hypothetical protein
MTRASTSRDGKEPRPNHEPNREKPEGEPDQPSGQAEEASRTGAARVGRVMTDAATDGHYIHGTQSMLERSAAMIALPRAKLPIAR